MKIFDTLKKIEEGFIMACFAVMAVVLGFQIFMRYVLNTPLIWSEEMARYIFVWATFIGAGYGFRHGIHISMEFFFVKMPPKMRYIVTLVVNFLSIAVFLILLPPGIRKVVEQSKIESSAMQIPMSFVFAAVPIGCVILAVNIVLETIGIIKSKGADL